MNNEWETKTLEEVCDFYTGLWKGKKPPYTKVGVIRNTNFTKEAKLDDSKIEYLYVETRQYEKKKLQYGDIILERSGGGPKQPVGRVIVFDKKKGEFSFSNFTSVIRVKDPNQLNFEFLHKLLHYYYLSGVTEEMQKQTTGIRNLDFSSYKKIEIPIPAIREQARIVKILNDKFATIEELKQINKKQVVDADQLYQSKLNEVFGSSKYEYARLEDYVNIKTGKLNANAAVEGGKYPFFTCSREVSNIDSYSFDCDAVLLAGNNASGDFNVKHYQGKFDAYQRTYVITMKNKQEMMTRFVHHLLAHGLRKFKESAVGAGTRFLKLGMIQDFEVPKLSLSEQKQAVTSLDEINQYAGELKSIFVQKSREIEELKRSYLQSAFAGKL